MMLMFPLNSIPLFFPPSDPNQFFDVHGPRWNLTGQVTLEESLALYSSLHSDLYKVRWNGDIYCAKVLRYIGGYLDDDALALLHKVCSTVDHHTKLPVLLDAGYLVGRGPIERWLYGAAWHTRMSFHFSALLTVVTLDTHYHSSVHGYLTALHRLT